jgi:hypothetical protein
MTITVANVDQTTDTFGGLITKVNQLAHAMTTKITTADSNTTTGNVSITNSFGANALFANSIAGGNLTTSSNLAIASNVYIVPYAGGNVVTVVGNSTLGSFATTIAGNSFTISTTGTTLFSGAKINVAVTNVDIVASTVKVTSGNSIIQANSSLGNIKVLGNGTTSNVTITGNDVWLSAVANINILSRLSVTNNVHVTGFVNASANVVASGFQYSNGASVGIIIYNAAGTQVFP